MTHEVHDLDGFVEEYLASEGKDETIEKLLQRWTDWKAQIKWQEKFGKFPFNETEVNYLNSRLLDGLFDMVKYRKKTKPTDIIPMGKWNLFVFIWLCKEGYFETAKWFLKIFPKANLRKHKDLAFRVACWKGHLQIAQWLYSLFPDINPTDTDYQRCNALVSASRGGQLSVVEWLYQTFTEKFTKANIEDAFDHACSDGHLSVVQFLHRCYPEMDIGRFDLWPFRESCTRGHLPVAQWLYDTFTQSIVSYNLGYIVTDACKKCNLDMVEWLYTKFPCSLIDSKNAFITSCSFGRLEIAQWIYNEILSKADDPNFNRDLEIDYPLRQICRFGHLSVAQWLQANFKLRPNIKYFKIACSYNQLEMAKWCYELWPRLKYDFEYQFKHACLNDNLKIARWIHSFKPVDVEKVLKEICPHLEVVRWLIGVEGN